MNYNELIVQLEEMEEELDEMLENVGKLPTSKEGVVDLADARSRIHAARIKSELREVMMKQRHRAEKELNKDD